MTAALDHDSVTERRERVAKLTRSGATAGQIAAELGITKRTVERIRAHCGVARPKPPLLSDDERRRAGELLDAGASFSEVGRTIGRSPSSVARAYPGRGWTEAQRSEFVSIVQRFRGVL